MLTLEHKEPLSDRLGADAGLDRAIEATDFVTPVACDSYVTDTICHLILGFSIVEHLGATSRPPCRQAVTALAVTAHNICTALQALNACSLGISRQVPHARIQASRRQRASFRRFRYRCEARGGYAVEKESQLRDVPESAIKGHVGRFPASIRTDHSVSQHRDHPSRSEWDDSLASAILHLVGAYRAMECLSTSNFPAAIADDFEIACHCLCAALVTLDTCLAGCEH
jgi:hypothetical protein